MSEPSSAMIAAVSAGTLDLAIVGLGPDDLPPALTCRVLGQDPLVAVVGPRHPLAGRATAGLGELLQQGQFIHFRRATGIRRYVDAAFARAGVPASGSFEMSQVHDMIRLAAHGVGVTIVPRSAVLLLYPPGHGHEQFRVLRLADKAAIHPVSVVYDAGRLAPAAAAFLGVLDGHVGTSRN